MSKPDDMAIAQIEKPNCNEIEHLGLEPNHTDIEWYWPEGIEGRLNAYIHDGSFYNLQAAEDVGACLCTINQLRQKIFDLRRSK